MRNAEWGMRNDHGETRAERREPGSRGAEERRRGGDAERKEHSAERMAQGAGARAIPRSVLLFPIAKIRLTPMPEEDRIYEALSARSREATACASRESSGWRTLSARSGKSIGFSRTKSKLSWGPIPMFGSLSGASAKARMFTLRWAEHPTGDIDRVLRL